MVRTVSKSSVEVVGNGNPELLVNFIEQELPLSVGHGSDRARRECRRVCAGEGREGGDMGWYLSVRDQLLYPRACVKKEIPSPDV